MGMPNIRAQQEKARREARRGKAELANSRAKQRRQPPTPGDVPGLRKCFICGWVRVSPDKQPPFRCGPCFAAVTMNEADGEL